MTPAAILLACTVFIAVNAQNQFLTGASFGAGSIKLNENQAYTWGPLTLPARVTLTNMRMTNNSGWTSTVPAFDLWFLSKTVFTSYSNGSSEEVKPIEGWLTTRAATNVTSVTNLYIPSTATTDSEVYIAIDNRPYGGRAPQPGASVTVAWDDIQWVTGDAVTKFNGTCGTITLNTGPRQAMYAEIGSGMPPVKATAVSSTGTGQFAAYIFDETNRDLYLATGNFSLNNTNGAICQNATVCSVANNGTWFFVLGANGSGSVTYDYAIREGTTGQCATTTTVIANTTATGTTTVSANTTTTVVSNTTTTVSANTTTTVLSNTTSMITNATMTSVDSTLQTSSDGSSGTTTTTDAGSATTTDAGSATNSTSDGSTTDVDGASTVFVSALAFACSLLATILF